jgi:transcriptional regulator GlxA family with amidase domain
MDRPRLASQTARITLVVPPRPSLMSIGAYVDAVTFSRSYIERQYSAIAPVLPNQGYGIATFEFVHLEERSALVEGIAIPTTRDISDRGYREVIVLADFDMQDDELGALDLSRFMPWIGQCLDQGALVVASGASVLLAAAAGLLRSRTATGPWWLGARLNAQAPGVRFDFGRTIIEDDGIVTTSGAGADVAAATMVIERIASRNTALWLSRRMGRLSPHSDESLAEDPLLMRAQQWLSEHFSSDVSISKLAKTLGVSQRTLTRHFMQGTGMSPLAYVQFLRVEAAKRMLERSSFRIDRIAGLVGYSDVGFFRHAFRRSTGKTPRQWRKEGAPFSIN